jgi:hypothetical protein
MKTQMTKSEIFKAAHKLAKTFEGNYTACFVLALAEVRNNNNNEYTLIGFNEWTEKLNRLNRPIQKIIKLKEKTEKNLSDSDKFQYLYRLGKIQACINYINNF